MYEGQEFEVDGHNFVFETEYDGDADPPWDNSCGHGPVSKWENRRCYVHHYKSWGKRPGERILSFDGNYARYYDTQEATKIAWRDGWGLGDEDIADLRARLKREPTRGDIVHAAVEKDFQYLKDWCDDRWHYIGVIVKRLDEDGEVVDEDSLWGVEDSDAKYAESVALEMAGDMARRANKEAKESAYWAERDVMTV